MADDIGMPAAKKVKTDSKTHLPECPYGAKCYRKNPQHLKEYLHADKGDAGTKHIDTSKLPVCSFGAKCYRKNLLHFAEYSHPTSGGTHDLPSDSGSDTDVYSDDNEVYESLCLLIAMIDT